MKFNFKKITAIGASILMVGMSIGVAAALYPNSFTGGGVDSTAIVYGSNSAASDVVGAGSISDYLESLLNVSEDDFSLAKGDFSDSLGVTEDEIVLGSSITSEIRSSLLDNKIPTLLDGEVNWDDGDGSKRYNFHEEINIRNNQMNLQTTLDNDGLDSLVVLENNQALEYKFVFDSVLTTSNIGNIDANKLYLTILGREYEILGMDYNSITVSLSDERIVSIGSVVEVDGVVLTVGDVFENSIEVSGDLIKEGNKKTIKGIEVYVDTIAYHSSGTLSSKAIIKVGKDIERTIENEDEYVDGDETWKWTIGDLGTSGGYIGVRYDKKSVGFDEDETEDNAITVGQNYVFPEYYASVIFNGLTNTTYEDFELSFDDKRLYDGNENSVKIPDDANVAILEGENDESIAFTLDGNSFETDSLYFRYVPESGTGNETINASVELYFKDIDGDIDNDDEGRIQFIDFDDVTDLKLVVCNTEMDVDFDVDGLTLTNDEEVISIPFGISELNEFKHLGSEKEDAESDDVKVDNTSIGTREEDVLSHYGVLFKNPESNANNDRVVLSVPSEQVYASVSVLGQGKEVITTEDTIQLGFQVVKDTEVASVSSKNLIVVGGSCINSVAAKLLGSDIPLCEGDWTAKTGAGAGQYFVEEYVSPYNSEKVALLVAGYNAADTTAAVSSLISSGL